MEIVTRGEAAASGQSQYFTGQPCKNGHVAMRYVQSGTCSRCIADATARTRSQIAGVLTASQAANRERVVDLAELKLRAYPEDAATLRNAAAAYCMAVYPTLTREDVLIKAPATGQAGGTALYRVRVPLSFAQALKETAEAMLNARAIDLAQFHARQLERTAADAEHAAEAPREWRFT